MVKAIKARATSTGKYDFLYFFFKFVSTLSSRLIPDSPSTVLMEEFSLISISSLPEVSSRVCLIDLVALLNMFEIAIPAIKHKQGAIRSISLTMHPAKYIMNTPYMPMNNFPWVTL